MFFTSCQMTLRNYTIFGTRSASLVSRTKKAVSEVRHCIAKEQTGRLPYTAPKIARLNDDMEIKLTVTMRS